MLRKRLLNYDYREDNGVFLPNKIFEDLQKNINYIEHIAFAYSFYFLITYLYKFGKFSTFINYNQALIKELLGIEGDGINQIIKEGGVLDKINYTKETTEYPVLWKWNEDDRIITYITNVDVFRSLNIKFPTKKVKMPLESYRYEEIINERHISGVEFFHNPQVLTFIQMIGDSEIGCLGFYLYGFLYCKFKTHGEKYRTSLSVLSQETGLSKEQLNKLLEKFEKKNYEIIISKKVKKHRNFINDTIIRITKQNLLRKTYS